MAEIRQIRVGGVTYDVVASEDEVAASRAQQYATQAQDSASQANTYRLSAAHSADISRISADESYQQQLLANDAADRAEAIVGGQFVSYGQNQGLSSAQKEQARANIEAGNSNPNLLDNPRWWSGEVVNQRNFSSTTTTGYTIDRWYVSECNGTVSLTANGLSFSPNNSNIIISQKLPLSFSTATRNKSLVFSVLIVDGTVNGAVFSNPFMMISGLNKSMSFAYNGGVINLRVCVTEDAFECHFKTNIDCTVRAVKLEMDSTSTIVADCTTNYGVELTRCVYSTADSTDDYSNSGFCRSNPNLLQNAWFGSGEVINQRGKPFIIFNEPGAFGYWIDRWKFEALYNTLTVSYVSHGMFVNVDSANSQLHFLQYLENASWLVGKTITASILLNNGKIYSGTIIREESERQVFFDDGEISLNLSNHDIFWVGVYGNKQIRAVKLELGSYSTLRYETPPDRGEELIKCIISTADPSDPYANQKYPFSSNPNLLDNPWWGSAEVINQRNLTSGTAPSFGYVIDRWKMNPSTSVTYSVGTTGITFTIPSGGYCQMIQYFPDVTRFNGKTLTCSVMMADGTIYSGSYTRENGTAQIFFQNTGSLAALLQTDNTLRVTAYTTQTIRAVKLELGSYSTLANDSPPNYAEELAKCMRYFQRINLEVNHTSGYGFAQDATSFRAALPISVPMRTAPTASFNGTIVLNGNGSQLSVTAVSAHSSNIPYNVAMLVFTTSGATQRQTYIVSATASNTYIDLSADL